LQRVVAARDDRSVPVELTIAFSLIGLAAVATAAVGLLLPVGDRLPALLALVAGAGVGIVALAIGSQIADPERGGESIFLVASILGFVATAIALVVLWRTTGRARAHADVSREGV